MINKKFLIMEYIQKKRTQEDIAKELKVSRKLITYYLKKHKIKARKRGYIPIHRFSRKYLYNEYIIKKRNTVQIAIDNSCNHGTIIRNLRKYGIELRRKPIPKEEFEELYLKKKLSIREIGRIKKLSPKGVRYYFIKYKIPRRKHKGINHYNYGENLSEKTKGKIREKLTGKQIGKENPNWRGGTSFMPYDYNFSNKFKRAIRKRDNQICMLCGVHREKISRALSIHHINYNKQLSIPQNCISLCRKCHGLTNHNRTTWIKIFQDILAKNYNYQYKDKEIILNV